MKLPQKLQLFFTVLEQKAAQNGLPMQVSVNDKESYVVDFYIHTGLQTFRLWWNINDKSDQWPDGSMGWSEYFGGV